MATAIVFLFLLTITALTTQQQQSFDRDQSGQFSPPASSSAPPTSSLGFQQPDQQPPQSQPQPPPVDGQQPPPSGQWPPSTGGISDPAVAWTHQLFLDPENRIQLSWTPVIDEIMFEVAAKTKGYVSIGFSPDGLMPMSDVVVGWVVNGAPTLQDRYAEGHIEPIMDTQQDYRLLSGHETETHTIFRFVRKYDTCDEQDVPITNNTMHVIYAINDQDPIGTALLKHTYAGSRILYMAGFDNPPMNAQPKPSDVSEWEFKMPNVSVPRGSTTSSSCQKTMVRIPPASGGARQIIGFEPVITSGHENAIDHIWLYECDSSLMNPTIPTDSNEQKGYDCKSPDLPATFGNCTKVLFAYGPGSKGDFMPPNVGYPVDDKGANFLLEIQYDSKNLKDMPDDSGLKVSYTSQPRKDELATVTVGAVLGASQIVPPTQQQFVTVGHCDAGCTKKALRPEGFYIQGIFLQGGPATQIKLQHIRQGGELSPIAEDNTYNSKVQMYRRLLDPVHVMPGDQLILECTYNTAQSINTLLGGEDTICLAHLQYYPRTDLQACVSSSPLKDLFDFLGTQNSIGMTPKTYEDLIPGKVDPKLNQFLRSYSWGQKAQEFQTLVRAGQYVPICGTRNLATYGYGALSNDSMPEVKERPKVFNPYYEHHRCSNGGGGIGGGPFFAGNGSHDTMMTQPPSWQQPGGGSGHDFPSNDSPFGGMHPTDMPQPGQPIGDITVGTDTRGGSTSHNHDDHDHSHDDNSHETNMVTTAPRQQHGNSATDIKMHVSLSIFILVAHLIYRWH